MSTTTDDTQNTANTSTAKASKIVLGKNQFGKAEVRVVKVDRSSARHELADLNVTSQLRGDFDSAHLEGNNEHVVATDTQKNTIFALSSEGITTPEGFLVKLANHFTSSFDWVSGGRWEAEQYAWERIRCEGNEHDHSFVRKGQEVRTAVVVKDGDSTQVIAGLKDLTVLKSTQSGFVGYPKDRFTSLPETTDRILATDLAARWRYNPEAIAADRIDFNAVYASVKALLLEGFAKEYSYALQHTLFQMAEKVLNAHPEIEEIRFSAPNNHHFLVDLSPFEMENPNEVFYAADRPYGLIEANFQRETISDAGNAWESIAGFC